MRYVILFLLLVSTIVFSPILITAYLLGAVCRIGQATFEKGYNGMDESIEGVFGVYINQLRKDARLYADKQTRGIK